VFNNSTSTKQNLVPEEYGMEKTKLETCIAILKILSQQPIFKLDSSTEARAFKTFPKKCMVFLEKQKLIIQKKTGKNPVYKTTERGIGVLNYFNYHKDRSAQITFRFEYQQDSFNKIKQATHFKQYY
jgi:hypothetical protein